MIGTHFQRLITSHHQSRLSILFMFEQSNIPRSSLLPFTRLSIEAEKLGAHLETFVNRQHLNLFHCRCSTLNTTSSISSCVLVSTVSVRRTTGSKWTSGDSSTSSF